MFELIIGDGKALQNASVPIRWCIDKEVTEILEEKKAINPHILLILTQKDNHYYEYRELIPLDQVMTYLNIQRPGVSTISAAIVWDPEGKNSRLKKKYLNRSGRHYDFSIMVKEIYLYDGYSIDSYYMPPRESYEKTTNYEIDVPNELFATYPDWAIRLINTWQDPNVIDQCHFRRRIIWFFSFKMWLMLFVSILGSSSSAITYALLTLSGFHHLSLRPILHPLKVLSEEENIKCYVTQLLTSDTHNIFLYYRVEVGKNKYEYQARKGYNASLWLAINPIVMLLLGAALWIISSILETSSLLAFIAFSTFGLLIFPLVYTLIRYVFPAINKWYRKSIRDRIEKSHKDSWRKKMIHKILDWMDKNSEARARKELARTESMLRNNPLVCKGDPLKMVARLDTIPKKDQTIRLRALTIKNAICKPLAQFR